jgi:nicotinate-nucleotide pyrophosphorylase (carboxylating)
MSSGITSEQLADVVDRALAEDVGPGDVTTEATVSGRMRASALISQKSPGVIYGLDVAEAVFAKLDPQVRCERLVQEGRWRESGGREAGGREAGGLVLRVEGLARALLTGERTALNFLGHLSGVASMAFEAAEAVKGTSARVLDTRKTTPGLRTLEKAAVAAGGASNHRTGLFDAILIKENHIAAAGGIANAIALARQAAPQLADTIEVEVRNRCEIEQALAAGAPRLLLDNMDLDGLRAAVQLVAGKALLEASGGVTLQRLQEVAETGVDFISVGALTHSAPTVDLSMMLQAL